MTDHTDDDLGLQPAAPSSPLADIRAGLFDGIEEEITEHAEDTRHVHLKIPSLDLPRFTVHAAYGRVTHAFLRSRFNLTDKQKRARPNWDLEGSIDTLLEACAGVYAQTPDGARYAFDRQDPDGDWPTFEDGWQAIAANLPGGSEITGPRELVRRLYAEGEIIMTGDEISRHSGYDKDALAGN